MDENKRKEMITETRENFDKRADNLKMYIKHLESFYSTFLKVKLLFVSFLGIILTIVFSRREEFSENFLLYLVIIIIMIFGIFIYDLWKEFRSKYNIIKKQYRSVMLSKILNLSTMRDVRFIDHGKRAMELLIQEDSLEQGILNNQSIDELISYKDPIPIVNFILWSLILVSIPVLFLLNLVNVF